MTLLDIRQRTGYLFMADTIGHIILISANVQTARGIPVLQAVTFGVFAEVQRGASSVIGGVAVTEYETESRTKRFVEVNHRPDQPPELIEAWAADPDDEGG